MNPQNTLDVTNLSGIHRLPPVQVKLASAGDTGVIAGLASPFGGQPDLYGDVVAVNAYAATIAEHKASGFMPPMLFSHDPARPIGRWLDMEERADGLHVRGQINMDSTEGREAFAHLKGRSVTGLSIGFRLPEGGYEYRADGVRVLHRIDLAEISVVALPAAPAARVAEIKSIEGLGSQREYERWLHRDVGVPRAAAAKLASGGWSALAGADQDEAALNDLARRVDSALAEIRALPKPNRYR
jgi:HK97 family phage prohead protease